MNYKIITDVDKLKDFIDWLPALNNGEAYYCCLFARSKYTKNLKVQLSSDRQQLKRFTSSKEFLFEKIKQLECEVGSYFQKHVPIPQEALALYITPNPRSFEKASIASVKSFVDMVTKPYSGYNPHQEVLTQIQKTVSRTVYFDFDFDGTDIDTTLKQVFDVVNVDAINVVQTRGGCHILLEMDKIDSTYKKTWYTSMQKISGLDQAGSNTLIPVVGTYQGGYTPNFYDLNKILV